MACDGEEDDMARGRFLEEGGGVKHASGSGDKTSQDLH